MVLGGEAFLFQSELAPFERFFEPCGDVTKIKWLRDVIRCALVKAAHRTLKVTGGCHQNDHHMVIKFLSPLKKLVPPHFRHVKIGHHGVESLFGHDFEGFLARVGHCHPVAGVLEATGENRCDRRLIVDYDNPISSLLLTKLQNRFDVVYAACSLGTDSANETSKRVP